MQMRDSYVQIFQVILHFLNHCLESLLHLILILKENDLVKDFLLSMRVAHEVRVLEQPNELLLFNPDLAFGEAHSFEQSAHDLLRSFHFLCSSL